MAAFVLLAAARGERLPLRLFTSVEGLASNSVNRIVRDSRRYLWFCTGEGLSRFDGSEFTTYRTDHGLPGRSVTDLLETRDGEYWAGTTSGGVAHFLPRTAERVKFETVPTSQEKGALHVNAMAQTEDGRIWCGTNAGLFRLEGTRPGWKFRHVDLGPMPEPWAEAGIDALLAGRAGNLWAGGPGGLWRIGKDGERARWTDRHGLTSPAVLSLRQERRGGLWAGTERGLCRLAADPKPDKRLVERCYTTRDGLPSDYTQELLVASSGELWAGTLHGAAMAIRGASGDVEGFDAITVRRGLSDDNIAGLAEDVEGNLWLGSTDDGGAMRLARLGAVMYGERDGLDSANVISVFEDRQGAVRAMTRSSKGLELHRFDGRRFIAAELRVPSGENRWGQGVEQVALEDRSGRWWVATGGGLLEYSQPERSDPRAVHLIPDPLSNGKNVFRVFQDAEGNIWWSVSSRGRSGLARWERRSRKTRIFSENDGLPSLQTSLPTAFTQDRSGAVWFGLMRGAQGVIRYRNGRFELFDAGPGGPLGVLRASHLDSSGRLWFGAGLGLWRVDQPEMDKPLFRRMGMDEGLSSPSIHALTEDRLGRIYAVSGSAVDRIDLKTGKVRHYTTADGLPLGTLQSAHRDRTGALWFGSTRGLARLTVEEEQSPTSPPPAVIRGLRVRGAPASISELGEPAPAAFELGPEENQIEFQFAAVHFKLGETLRFQYRLEGSGAGRWSAPSEARWVNFASLKPGRYQFLVRTISADGRESAEAASVTFRIRPPLWATWWFELAAAALAAAIVYAAHLYRMRQILETARLRTRIATDLHDDIGSSLSRIAILTDVAAREADGNATLAERLERIGDVSREVVDSMSDIVWAVNPQNDSFADLAARMRRVASDLAGSNDVRLQFQTGGEPPDKQVGTMARREVFLIFKEALNNALRHSGCKQTEVRLCFDSGWISLEIADDGRGFDPRTAAKGNGLDSMRSRAEGLGGTLTVESAPGRGTRIHLRAPALGRFR